MKSFIRARVYKNCVVESENPRVLTPIPLEEILWSQDHIKVEEEVERVLPQKESSAGELALEAECAETGKILEEARLRADEIVAQAMAKAEAEAQKLIAQAKAEAEEYKEQIAAKVRSEAMEQGYASGFEQGHAAGFEQGLTEGQQEAQKIRTEAQKLLNLATKAYDKEYVQAEERLIHLAIKIAERILRAQITAQPSKLIPMIKDVLRLPHERGNWRLHIAKEDALWLRPMEQELGIPLVEDDHLDKGDCFLECEEGIYDARLTSQLHVLEEALREEFRRGELEQAVTSD